MFRISMETTLVDQRVSLLYIMIKVVWRNVLQSYTKDFNVLVISSFYFKICQYIHITKWRALNLLRNVFMAHLIIVVL